MMTVAPSSRNNFADSSPMPEVPPVTTTILFDSFMIFSWFEGFWGRKPERAIRRQHHDR